MITNQNLSLFYMRKVNSFNFVYKLEVKRKLIKLSTDIFILSTIFILNMSAESFMMLEFMFFSVFY